MISVILRVPGAADPPAGRSRRKFGLDAPLPADRRIIERALLRHLAECRPEVVVLALRQDTSRPDTAANAPIPVSAGVPDLLLLAPKGRSLFVKIKTQAEDLSRADRAFADLCQQRGIPLVVVRCLPEARRAFDLLSL
ncbi:VRR-NUC domain-containing protein [Lichenifustis flavocetrariae]|uniref:VRR-NUC domain-containing protein n=1 Tax=Lichenifustis flavocetrariae TaxID=2949735 RepID=A0AA42CLT8_9HYPH|nr:VRR-NUC domain-containing protein [Lichenifustis flavocetrariae]MCW6507727.1 hypothetical protein [Lichenifustis flavocetrariae]